MNDPDTATIELTRNLTRKLIGQVTARGIEPADATVALAYALHDAASELTGSHADGLEWMRQAIAVMANQVEGKSDAPTSH
ncbi:hypothetical protein [Qipengyuania huizhouensis]|uniref:hypothetical protein n=1 Tax=Qipengyuania huizhouensis TaxID=2867245 RepID=UPI001C87BBE9|nr:hypothetical protein [Qipengyuania huizhouensis]MBX7460815.1 hypothetical protein [Qipengyuania huizhouensis]